MQNYCDFQHKRLWISGIRKTIKADAVPFIYKNYQKKLRSLHGFTRPLKVIFLVSEAAKWQYQSLYNEMKQSKDFEPIIIVVPLDFGKNTSIQNLDVLYHFFTDKGMEVAYGYDKVNSKFITLDNFNPDIVFYQQPWNISPVQDILPTSRFALTCYCPYCFHMLETDLNYMAHFHSLVWQYYVESDLYKTAYLKKYGATNCVTTGNLKLDNYFINYTESAWNNRSRKRIIYAPHHSFGGFHNMATFARNGEFILQLAQQHPEIEWIFKPHPRFKYAVVAAGIKTEEEIQEYYDAWEKIGRIYETGNYYDLFMNSDALITDCISFLAEYLPTQKPVFFLRNKNQGNEFTLLGRHIIQHYYQTYDNYKFLERFDDVIFKGNDVLKNQRIEDINYLKSDNTQTVATKILTFIREQL